MQTLLPFFSGPLRQRLASLPFAIMQTVQEIRVREQRPLELGLEQRYSFVSEAGGLCEDPAIAYRATHEDCAVLLEMLTQHSLYTFEEELRRGYITVAGGHRVGLAGRAVLEQGKVKLLKDISSFNIRIAKEHTGCALKLLPYLIDASSPAGIHHTLIVSPPQQGKTTLIRDLARLLSSGGITVAEEPPKLLGVPPRVPTRTPSRTPPEVEPIRQPPQALTRMPSTPTSTSPPLALQPKLDMPRGYKVGIVDERSEIAACTRGVPRFDLGPRTDVLDGCPKAEGMMMMIRSMSPELIIVDEIGRPEDAAAIHEAVHAGIRVIATAHGSDYADLSHRPVLKELLQEAVFTRIVLLGKHPTTGSIAAVYDGEGRPLFVPESVPSNSASRASRDEGKALC
nr:stage III sporulation protein AA [Paenibacillus agricola]